MLMSSFCFYRVSNRHTFGEIFQIDLSDDRSSSATSHDLRRGDALHPRLNAAHSPSRCSRDGG
jgi:hypothetical protein